MPKEITALPLLYRLRFSLEVCMCKLIGHPGHSDTATYKGYSHLGAVHIDIWSSTTYCVSWTGTTYRRQHAAPPPRRCKLSSVHEHIWWASPAFRSMLCPHRYLVSSKRLHSPTGSTYIDWPAGVRLSYVLLADTPHHTMHMYQYLSQQAHTQTSISVYEYGFKSDWAIHQSKNSTE